MLRVRVQVRVLLSISHFCNDCPQNQLAIAKATGIPPLIQWLSGSLDTRAAFSADAQCEAAHALLSVAANNSPLQAIIAKSEAIPALIELVSKGSLRTQEYAARALWHLASSSEIVTAIADLKGMAPLVAMLSLDDQRAQELAAVVVSRLTRSHAQAIAEAGGIVPLVSLTRAASSTPAAQQHAASAIADIGMIPAHRDMIAFESQGIPALVGAEPGRQPECAPATVARDCPKSMLSPWGHFSFQLLLQPQHQDQRQ